MAQRKAYHQFDPVFMSRKKFEGLEARGHVKAPAADTYYRDPAYPEEVFTFHPAAKGEGEKRPDPKHPNDRSKDVFHPHPKGHGEWRMGAVDLEPKE